MKPNKLFKNIYDITPEFIERENVKGLLVDMDNTLLPWHETTLSDETLNWIKLMEESGVKVCVITNSGIKRTGKVMDNVNLDFIHTAVKPFPFSFIKGRKILGVKKENLFVVGDQMVTDALGSKIVGYKCIIVEPISPKEQKGTAVNRFFERLLFGRDVREMYDDK